MSYASKMAEAWRLADVFNQQVAISTPVKLKNENGKEIECAVASEAFALPDGSVNILIQRPGGAIANFKLELEGPAIIFPNPPVEA